MTKQPDGRDLKGAALLVAEMTDEDILVFAQRDPDIFRAVARYALRKLHPTPRR